MPNIGLIDFTTRLFSEYEANWHHKVLAAHLEAVADGRIKRLMVFMPPQNGKSELVSARFPSYYLWKYPNHRVILSSYAADLALGFSQRSRDNFFNEDFPAPKRKLSWSTWAKSAWNFAPPLRGGLIAAGVGGGITGKSADLIIIDDPFKNMEEADSSTKRDAVWSWYQSAVYTRIRKHTAIVIVQTRWHEDDLSGRLQREAAAGGQQWVVLSLPAIAEKEENYGPFSRSPGDALWPERYPVEFLAETRRVVGARVWAALYQQRPAPIEGALIKTAWLTKVIPRTAIPSGLRWFRYWDLAVETKKQSDYTASVAVAVDDQANVYLRDMVRMKAEWPDVKRRIVHTCLAEPDTIVGIESAMHGAAGVQELRRNPVLAGTSIKAVHVDKDKVTRAMGWSARAEAGQLFLVEGPWLQDFIDEAIVFPQGTHDDQVDAVSGALRMAVSSHVRFDLDLGVSVKPMPASEFIEGSTTPAPASAPLPTPLEKRSAWEQFDLRF